jgi:hypothetical protein
MVVRGGAGEGQDGGAVVAEAPADFDAEQSLRTVQVDLARGEVVHLGVEGHVVVNVISEAAADAVGRLGIS